MNDLLPKLENYVEVPSKKNKKSGESEMVKVPKPPRMCMDEAYQVCSGNIYNYSSILFYYNAENKITVLNKPADLHSYLSRFAHVFYCKVTGAVSMELLFNYMRDSLPKVTSVSETSLFPATKKPVCAHIITPRYTGALDELINLFHPASEIDRCLIKAMFLTPFHSGLSGQRPVFVIDSVDGERGKGYGKTTLADTVHQLAGNHINYPWHSEKNLEDVIVNAAATNLSARTIRIDNVKTRAPLGKAEMESVITSPMITGHKFYTGQIALPNNFTIIVTMNGAEFGEDMAQRCVPILLEKPDYTDAWIKAYEQMMQDRKADILADIGQLLCSSVDEPKIFTRFVKWQCEIFARVTKNPAHITDLKNRQDASNVDMQKIAAFDQFVVDTIDDWLNSSRSHNKPKCHLHYLVTNETMRKLLGIYLNDRNITAHKTTKWIRENSKRFTGGQTTGNAGCFYMDVDKAIKGKHPHEIIEYGVVGYGQIASTRPVKVATLIKQASEFRPLKLSVVDSGGLTKN